ncbi:exodeoxyribonuclease V subunit alpha [Azohydromonas caseinilytica]|uniref:RecBCD enzyme subunit RecD n=1 Tax=Azohydromonas caseinilytica TaxID=2728836 RepID=A0A848FG17_9BURK|nr:exodeoxyribonuclease V subunit alpha [Azohydromonas caseinilytica]NML18314.1 exodeoxyribonuclease V subunit alpha [Azohydromonas caseinilytica]
MKSRKDANTLDWIEAMEREPLPADELLAELLRWARAGWLRHLDGAVARFALELEPGAHPLVLLCGALVAHMESRGHSCLLLEELHERPDELLSWSAEPREALRAVLQRLPGELPAWLDTLRGCALVQDAEAVDGHGEEADSDTAPLVLCGTRLYLRRYWHYEQRVAAQVRLRGALREAVDTASARAWLERLFAAEAGQRTPKTDWQKVACAVALRGRLSVITGGPGTGKTYTVARLLALLLATAPHPERLRIALAAPTGKAAARLKQSIEGSLQALAGRIGDALDLAALTARIGAARTLHGLLGGRPDTRRFAFDASHPLDVDVLIVDEASMIHLEMMAALLEALPETARVVLLGDKDQLASVEAGAVLGDLCGDADPGGYDAECRAYVQATCGTQLPEDDGGARSGALAQQIVMLRESRRFGGPIGKLALAVNQGKVAAAQRVLRDAQGAEVHWLEAASPQAVVRLALEGRPGAPGGYAAYLQALRERPQGEDEGAHAEWATRVLTAFERFRVLCAVREGDWGVEGFNLAIEAALLRAGWLRKTGEWYEGRPVMVTRNQPALGVFNGDIGIVLRAPGARGALRVYLLEGPQLRSVLASRLADVATAFALTVHKSQGSEFEHTVLALPDQGSSQVLTRELAYTGITRARTAFTLVSPQPGVLAAAIERKTKRASGLREALAG